MLIAARNAMLAGGAALPYDAEVEYLESSGTQYIDTGIVPTNTTGALAVFEIAGVGSSNYILGSRGEGVGRFYVYNNEASSNVKYGWGDMVTTNRSVVVGRKVVARLNYYNDRIYAYDGMKVADLATADFSRNTYTMYIAATNFAGVPYFSGVYLVGKIYNCAITSGPSLVRDFIPVRFTNELGNTEGAMYDRVSGTLFRNAGTGAFVIGPDAA